VSLVLATQRPSAVSEVAVSQSDIVVSHRLTSEADLAALEAAQPTYMGTSLAERLPTSPGEVLVIDDATETVHSAAVRRRETPHGGDSPSASDVEIHGDRTGGGADD
jgi:DNA helicase HerA-like ATPase